MLPVHSCRAGTFGGVPLSGQLNEDRDYAQGQQYPSEGAVQPACGFNAALWGGSQAAAVREAWRLALFGVLSPLGKLEDTVTLSWQELRASDLSGRARAFQSLVGGGKTVEEATAIAGLMIED